MVRSADPADLPRIAAIYDDQVRTAISTFDLEPRPMSYWEDRLASDQPGDHLLVADSPSGEVVGYAYSSSYRPRPAYARTRETSVYLDDCGARAGPGPTAVRRAARPAARRRRAPGARGDRAAQRRERGAAPRVRLRAGGPAARGRLEVRPLDRHRAVGAHAACRRASRIGCGAMARSTESQSPSAARHGVRVRPESWRTHDAQTARPDLRSRPGRIVARVDWAQSGPGTTATRQWYARCPYDFPYQFPAQCQGLSSRSRAGRGAGPSRVPGSGGGFLDVNRSGTARCDERERLKPTRPAIRFREVTATFVRSDVWHFRLRLSGRRSSRRAVKRNVVLTASGVLVWTDARHARRQPAGREPSAGRGRQPRATGRRDPASGSPLPRAHRSRTPSGQQQRVQPAAHHDQPGQPHRDQVDAPTPPRPTRARRW